MEFCITCQQLGFEFHHPQASKRESSGELAAAMSELRAARRKLESSHAAELELQAQVGCEILPPPVLIPKASVLGVE